MNRVRRILEGAVKNERVASAYLFVGGSLSTKLQAAHNFVQFLGCKKQDIFEIKPAGTTLKIEQIRELSSWVRFGPSAGEYLLVIIQEADKMTPEATAAFLKTLEEPPPGVVFVLLCEREEKLPETIISRCQKIIFPETQENYQPNKEFDYFYQEFKKLSSKSITEVLDLSSKLAKEKERIEELLYDLAHYFRYQSPSIYFARTLLAALRNIKKRANLKLTLDVMCLRLAANGKKISDKTSKI